MLRKTCVPCVKCLWVGRASTHRLAVLRWPLCALLLLTGFFFLLLPLLEVLPFQTGEDGVADQVDQGESRSDFHPLEADRGTYGAGVPDAGRRYQAANVGPLLHDCAGPDEADAADDALQHPGLSFRTDVHEALAHERKSTGGHGDDRERAKTDRAVAVRTLPGDRKGEAEGEQDPGNIDEGVRLQAQFPHSFHS